MAPFRGRGGQRGGQRGSSRGGSRGSSRGGQRGSSRGGSRGGQRGGHKLGRGAPTTGSNKLARSGIRTRGGYKKFDSQRVKDVDASGSEDEVPQAEDESEELDEELSDSEDEEVAPSVKAYSALMQSFQQPAEQDGRKRKRRKIDAEEHDVDSNGLGDGSIDGEVPMGANEDDEEGEEGDQDGGVDAGLSVEGEEEDEDDASDPYDVHFADAEDNELSRRLKAVQANEWRTDKQPVTGIGNLSVSMPKSAQGNIIRKPAITSAVDLPLKKRLADSSRKHLSTFDQLQQATAPYIFNYNDMLVGNRTPQHAEKLRSIACLHALNHVLKGRDKILKNTTRLSQASNPETLDLRDQGFTRPKVLILTETRQMAYNYGECIVSLFAPEQQENKQRFKDSFTAPIDDRDTMLPEDYRELFDGNNDNSFLTALKFTRKTLKFFSAFYASDIILASPLGLRRIIENEDVKKRDHDFLSSIEMVIIDQADAMQMQNWENVEVVFKHLNLQPKESHGTDFNRVRSFYLDGHAKYLRQTIIFSAYITPEMNRLFNTSMLNIAGKAKLAARYDGAITAPSVAGLGIKQTFSRFDAPNSPASDPDARFKHFTTALLPSLLRLPKPADGSQGILVFIPSYFDFLRLRNFFATATLTQNISFGAIHDYSDVSSQRRARSHFLSGRHGILLYTQRAHHFFRLRLRGVKRVVMYGLPDNEFFYRELVGGMLGTSVQEGRVSPEEVGMRCLFCKWDGLRLERVVGSGRVKGMLGGVGDTFDFV